MHVKTIHQDLINHKYVPFFIYEEIKNECDKVFNNSHTLLNHMS